MHGSFVVQCKHTTSRTSRLIPSAIQPELPKIEKLASEGLCENYLIMTNHSVTSQSAHHITKLIQAIPNVRHAVVFGMEWINQTIRDSPRLRMLVPRVYGLGDLSNIMDHRSYDQAREILAYMSDDLAKFVITDAYTRSVSVLAEHGFVILLGEPAAGKTTIAASLALGATDRWNSMPIKVGTAEQFRRRWNPHESHQLFWVDDVFGSTQYQRELAYGWNQEFAALSTAISKGTKAIFTSRTYIYRSAIGDIKTSAFPGLVNSQVVINVQELSLAERRQILYNHIKLGNQPKEFRSKIKRFLPSVAEDRAFLPETARRLGMKEFTGELKLSASAVQRFVEEPIAFLIETIRSLDEDSRGAIAFVFLGGGSRPSPLEFTRDDKNVLELLGISPAKVKRTVEQLDGSFLKHVKAPSGAHWIFKHPTIADAFSELVSESIELIDVYLAGTDINKLLQEVVCDDIEIEGAKVRVPGGRYEELIRRIDDSTVSERSRAAFLSYRCGKGFLVAYARHHPTLLQDLAHARSYFYAVVELQLLYSFFRFGLLSEELRRQFASEVRSHAVQIPDSGFLTVQHVRAMLTDEEVEGILADVRSNLIPKLDDVIDSWRDSYSTDEDPEDYFVELRSCIKDYATQFAGESESYEALMDADGKIERVTEELREEYYRDNAEPDDEEYGSWGDDSSDDRDIFDDVDR